jgi:aldose 1-epimerase
VNDRPTAAVRMGVVEGEPAVTLAAGELEATFLPGLGLLGTSLRHRGEQLLALPGGVAGYRDRKVTGLPILAPWANRLPGWRYRAAGTEVDLRGLDLPTDPGGLPIHGTLTAHRGWRLERLAAEDDRAVLEGAFDYGAWPELLAAFPFPHRLTVAAAVQGASLAVTTTLAATGGRPVPVAFGWHPYLRIPGAPRASWRLLLPDRRHLELDDRGLPTGKSDDQSGEADPVGDRIYDDLYALGSDPAGRRLGLEAAGRRLLVDYGDGYGHAQVFAPPGAEFVCLEPMTGPVAALAAGTTPLVRPGDSFAACFVIRVEDA